MPDEHLRVGNWKNVQTHAAYTEPLKEIWSAEGVLSTEVMAIIANVESKTAVEIPELVGDNVDDIARTMGMRGEPFVGGASVSKSFYPERSH